MIFTKNNIRIAGVSGAVPQTVETIEELVSHSHSKEEAFKIKRTAMLAGLKCRAVAPESMTIKDLAVSVGKHILKQLNWDSRSVSSLFFITQTPDLLMPATGYLIHHEMQLSPDCLVTDITASCSGLVHGIALASQLVSKENDRVLVIAGDTMSKTFLPEDIGNQILFGDGVGAVALEYSTDESDTFFFNLTAYPDENLDLAFFGSGYFSSQFPKGFFMRGDKIMEFSRTRTVENINQLLSYMDISLDDIETCFFHQPNLMLLEFLAKKMKISMKKIPTTIAEYGNCSSANIALLLANYFQTEKFLSTDKYLLCGFGGGLEVASLIVSFNNTMFFPPIHI